MKLTIAYRGQKEELDIDQGLTLQELMLMIEEVTQVPSEMQKLIAPKVGAVKLDTHGGDRLVSEVFPELSRAKIMLVGTPINVIKSVQEAELVQAEREKVVARRLAAPRVKANKAPVKALKYTFGRLVPLPHLPNPEQSLEFLERLRNDRGIQAVMERHQWNVGILTELDPATSTTHTSKLLGLNVNKGQAIKLRLRTDDYEGYLEYKMVIKTLCHELAHNVHSEHDRDFWDLTNKLEREVIALDPFGGAGHRLTNMEIYNPESSLGTGHAEALHVDSHGVEESQGHLLGGGTAPSTSSSSSSTAAPNPDEDIRSSMRRAAEQRKRDT